MRRARIISMTLVVALLISIGLVGAVQAKGGFPTPQPPPDENGFRHGEQCSIPGIVVNSSNKRIRITGDTWENGRLVWKRFYLHPGQRSTQYLCDTDYIGHIFLDWDYNGLVVSRLKWSPYILNTTQTCRDHTVNGVSSFRCQFTKWNWGPTELNSPSMRSVSLRKRHRPNLHTGGILTMFIFIVRMALAIFFLLCLSGCVTLDELLDGPRPDGPLPTMEPVAEACFDPPPSLPDTDCTAWGYLHSLVINTSRMGGEMADMGGEMAYPTETEYERLEKEIYPLFVQTQLNCGQWVEPRNDYEPISDVLAMLAFLGTETYDYDPSDLIEFLLRGAAQEEFALSAEEIGCVKSLFGLFISYEEND